MVCQDQLNRSFIINRTPTRIVSLVPSLTELLVDLGLESSIVGVTKFCVHPAHLRQAKTVIGGTKQVDFQKIKDLNPDIILCNKEENTQEMIAALERISNVHISDIYNLNDALELIHMYGRLFSVEKNANHLMQHIEKEYEAFSTIMKGKRIRKVAYFIWKSPWMVAAPNTFIDYLLGLNKFKNYFEDLERYPEIELSDIHKDIDIVLLSSEPYPFRSKHVEKLKELFPDTKVILVDGEYFSWYGSRLSKAFKYFIRLHQTLKN